jgi:hypothetical protein
LFALLWPSTIHASNFQKRIELDACELCVKHCRRLFRTCIFKKMDGQWNCIKVNKIFIHTRNGTHKIYRNITYI